MKKLFMMALTVLLASCTNNSKVSELIKKAEQGDAAGQGYPDAIAALARISK